MGRIALNKLEESQSRFLTWLGTICLFLAFLLSLVSALRSTTHQSLIVRVAICLSFGSIVWLLRAATLPSVAIGSLVCFLILSSPGSKGYSGFAALATVFILSFAATRFHRNRKESMGLAESRRGRRSSQIVANLGAAALFAAAGHYAGCIAALAEAASDTISSEIGQGFPGQPRLITTWKPVPAGTDGAVSLGGTLAGIIAAAIVTVIGTAIHYSPQKAAVIFLCACFGLFFDSLLGATLQRRGFLGNDLVNFLSTVVSGLLAVLALQ